MRLTEIVFQPSESQQKVLLGIFIAQTPKIGYEYTEGDERLQVATELLDREGLIRVDYENKEAEITDEGINMLRDYALIDDSDNITEDGKRLIASSETDYV